MKFNTAIGFIDYAIDLTRERIKRNPSFPVYASVINQLLYIKAVFDGVEKDKSRLHKLSIGALAAKEFEDTDYELARALMDVYYIANQSANGLKVKLPEGLWRP
ncbi:immunity protein Tsi6 family protein [Pseudomonas syringae]|uniref:immunity protein Tsi6 family protein n=1 Tax=Pseudomonas syringae TaxID=317 RepID=UPI000628985D|nr:immunity protein Tsi6 family protein [Pseudomonas syringae]